MSAYTTVLAGAVGGSDIEAFVCVLVFSKFYFIYFKVYSFVFHFIFNKFK